MKSRPRPPPLILPRRPSPLTFIASPMSSSPSTRSPSPVSYSPISLRPANVKKKPSTSPNKIIKGLQTVCRSFKKIHLPSWMSNGNRIHDYNESSSSSSSSSRVTGTFFGYREARVSFAIQDTPRSLPILVLELALETGKLLEDMGQGFFCLALECKKKPEDGYKKIVDEPIWSVCCNCRRYGCGVKRKANEEDLGTLQMLNGVSMGAGVLPSIGDENVDRDMKYMRAQFDRVAVSKDSETYYMDTSDWNNGPELSIFFVRV